MDILGRSYIIPRGVGMNHSICCVAGIFPWGPTKKGQIFWPRIKLEVLIVKTPVQAVVCFLGAGFMLQVPFDKILKPFAFFPTWGIHVITFDGGKPLRILTGLTLLRGRSNNNLLLQSVTALVVRNFHEMCYILAEK